jgi:hypothetical protein
MVLLNMVHILKIKVDDEYWEVVVPTFFKNVCLPNEDILDFEATPLVYEWMFIVQTTGSMIFQSSFFPFSFFVLPPSVRKI